MPRKKMSGEPSSGEASSLNQSEDANRQKRLLKLLEHQMAVNTDPCVIMELSESDIINLGVSLDMIAESSDIANSSEHVEASSSSILVSDDAYQIPLNIKIKTEPDYEEAENQLEVIEYEDASSYEIMETPDPNVKFQIVSRKVLPEIIVKKSEFVIRKKSAPYRYVLYSSFEDQKLFQCKACQECFNSKRALLRHFKEETEERSCRYKRENPNVRTLEKIFQCNICYKLFGNEVILYEHSNTHEFETEQIEGKKIKASTLTLKKDDSSLNEDLPSTKYYECDTCNKCFYDYEVFRRHQRYHSKNRPYKCDRCKKEFARLGDLKRHKLTHKGERPFSCHVCNFAFTRQADLQRHYQTHTGYKPFECHLCIRRFGRQADLNRHQLVHAREKAFKCKVCDKGFHRRPDLEKHGLKHTGKRPYHCQDCSKSFTHERGLNKHIMRHRENRPYRCQYCEKSYMKEETLEKHMLKHSFDKMFSCFVCNKNFCFHSDLERHFLTHTGQKEYECDVCNKCFSRKFDCIRHRRIHGWWSEDVEQKEIE